MRNLMVVAVVMLGACGGDEVPSCMQATEHYYASGCVVTDVSTNPPGVYTQTQAQSLCQNVNNQVPDRCQAEFDDWKSCMGGTPAHATTNADCDCSVEIDALFGCQ